MDSSRWTLADVHCRQIEQHYCIPACCVMVETWRGHPPQNVELRQRELFDDLRSGLPWPSESAAALRMGAVNHGAFPGAITANTVQLVTRTLRDKCAFITCWSGPTGKAMLERGLKSVLGNPHSDPRPHHAIVIMAPDSKIVALDPWFDAEGQPVQLSTREFVKIWTGYMAVFERP